MNLLEDEAFLQRYQSKATVGTSEEYREVSGAQTAHAGTKHRFRVESRCPLVGISDILPTMLCKC